MLTGVDGCIPHHFGKGFGEAFCGTLFARFCPSLQALDIISLHLSDALPLMCDLYQSLPNGYGIYSAKATAPAFLACEIAQKRDPCLS